MICTLSWLISRTVVYVFPVFLISDAILFRLCSSALCASMSRWLSVHQEAAHAPSALEEFLFLCEETEVPASPSSPGAIAIYLSLYLSVRYLSLISCLLVSGLSCFPTGRV